MQIEPRAELKDLPPTVHGGQGWKLSGVEDYSQNLNPMGPPPGLAAEVQKALGGIGHYPDALCTEDREVIAKYFDIRPENVVMGAGSSEIIRNFPAAFMERGDLVLMPRPSFAEYTQQIKIAGAQVDYFDLSPDSGFHIDFEDLESQLQSTQYKALYLCNPNNPTGVVESKDNILKIVKVCEDMDTLVFLDETLLGLSKDADLRSCASYINDYTNLLVAESFTKSFAIPGMRIGFGLSNPEICAEMQKVSLPWNLGTVEQAVVKYLMDNMGYVDVAAKELRKESEIMQARLEDIGFPVGPVSDSFFYFVSCRPLGLTGAEMQKMMLKEGIMVRDCASFGPQFEDYIRYCVKDRARNERFISVAEKVMSSFPGL